MWSFNWQILTTLVKENIFFDLKIFSEIFYIGIPTKKFPDFKKISEYILGGRLLEKIGATEALDSAILEKSKFFSYCTVCTQWF